jgi:hypothetical protein
MTAPVASPNAPSVRLAPVAPGSTLEEPPEVALLPNPENVTSAEFQDAMTMMYLLLNARASIDMSNAQAQIASRQTAKEHAFNEQLEALRRAAEAEGEGSKGFFDSLVDLVSDVLTDLANLDLVGALTDPLSDMEYMWNSPKFWQDLEAGAGFIAKAALIAGGIAATVATAGSAGLVVAGIALALSAGGAAIQETDCLDSVFGKGASDWIGLGMQVAGAVICYASAGAAAGSTLNTVTTATNVGGGAAAVVTGGAHARVAKFRGDVVDAEADAMAARQRGEKMLRLVEWLIDGLQETEKSHQRAKETLGQAIEQQDQAQQAAVFTSGRQLS